MTIEFNIFHHTDRNMYEIAAYNSEKDFEFVPLFLIDGVIKDMIMDHTTINTEIEKLKVKLSKDRFTHIPGHDDMIELAKVSLFNNFVESHLHPKFDGTLDFANLPGETFDLEATIFTPPPVVEEVFDEEENLITLQNARGTVDNKSEKIETTACNPTVAKSPVANKPLPPAEKVTKVQRKRASIAEFNHTLSILKKDSKSLKNANKMTENLLNLSEESVGAFKQALQRNAGTSKFYDKSTPIGKFRWAVHRIVLQQYIEAVKLRIDEMSSGAKKPMRINGTFPMPGSTDMYSAQNKILSLQGRLKRESMQSLSECLSRDGTPRGSRQGTPTTTTTTSPPVEPLLQHCTPPSVIGATPTRSARTNRRVVGKLLAPAPAAPAKRIVQHSVSLPVL